MSSGLRRSTGNVCTLTWRERHATHTPHKDLNPTTHSCHSPRPQAAIPTPRRVQSAALPMGAPGEAHKRPCRSGRRTKKRAFLPRGPAHAPSHSEQLRNACLGGAFDKAPRCTTPCRASFGDCLRKRRAVMEQGDCACRWTSGPSGVLSTWQACARGLGLADISDEHKATDLFGNPEQERIRAYASPPHMAQKLLGAKAPHTERPVPREA